MWDWLLGRKSVVEEQRDASLSLNAWADLLTSFTYQGHSYTLPGASQEEPSAQFSSLVGAAYKSNGVVFACMLTRMLLFSEARFQFRQLRSGRPGRLFGNPDLGVLETPWPGGTTGDLLGKMIQHADLAGNAFVAREGSRLVVLRPDWVDIAVGSNSNPDSGVWDVDAQVLGYVYYPGGKQSGRDPVPFMAGEVAHFAPIPDPQSQFRGMSWLTPIVREVMADKAMTDHKLSFMENGATPNMIVKFDVESVEKMRPWVEAFRDSHEGARNAYKTLFLSAGADATVVGKDLQELDFKNTQGAGETRIAAAAGVPPVIVGLSEGLQAATYCLPADELVWTLDGPRPIVDVAVGDEVWTSEGSPAPGRVVWQGNVGEKQVIEIKTKNRTITATDNHPVLVRVPGHSRGANPTRAPRLEWRAVGELRVGDQVVQANCLPDRYSVQPEWASPDLVRWLGAYMGDGSGAGKDGISMAIPPTDRARFEYERLTAELFDARIGHEPRSFRMHSRGISEMVAMLGFAGTAKTKRIPGWVFRLPRELRLQFLAGLIDTDGYIDRRGVGRLGFANLALVEQARALFVSCGIQTSNVTYRKQMGSALPNPGLHESYNFWSFAITTGLGSVPTFDPLYRQRLENRRDAREGGDIAKAGLDPSEFGFYTVRSITPGDTVPVYDITVEGSHSFFAGGIAVHNSNYGQARRRLADGTMSPLWRNAAGSLSRIVRVPDGAELWYDARDIPFLKEDQKDAAEIQAREAATIKTLVDAGFTPESVVSAVVAGDFQQLKHTHLFSVQLQPPGTTEPSTSNPGMPEPSPAGEGENSLRDIRLLLDDLVPTEA